MLGKRKDRAPRVCDWCQVHPAVSRRRCQRCKSVSPEERWQLGTADAKRIQGFENVRKKKLPGARARALEWKLNEQDERLRKIVHERAGVQQAGG